MPESKVCSRYVVSSADSVLIFDVKSNLHGVRGKTSDVTGYIDACLESDGSLAADPPTKMHVEFPVEKLRSGNDMQDREMRRLIDSARFPRVLADLRDIQPAGSGKYVAQGDVTLAGRARSYSGNLTVSRDGDKLVVDGELPIDIRDFGLRPPQLLFLKVDPVVTVRLHLVAAAAAT